MNKVSGEFEVSLVPKEAVAPEGTAFGVMVFDKTFEGALKGSSQGMMLSVMTEVKGSAGYVALETITGSLEGREGSFTCQHLGTMDRGEQSLTLNIIPDSGTGALAGISGSMNIRIEGGKHHYDIEYQLPEG